jgi:deoxycytidylate deaminase
MLSISTLLQTAFNESFKSTHKQRMAAVIFNKNRIISVGYNKPQTHRKKLHPKFQRFPNSIHAEAAAILNAKTDLKNCSILITRLDAEDNFTYAKPCNHCKEYISYVGIRTIYYTITENPLEYCKLGVLRKNKPFMTKIFNY